jgi:hypothetical protein
VRPRVGRAVAAAGLILLLAAVPDRVADAHGLGGLQPSDVESRVLRVTPPVAGLRVDIANLGATVVLTNATGATVTVEGYEGEPYLRVTPDGVERNRRSPATYLNEQDTPTSPAPEVADATAPPDWQRWRDGTTARWHDHRSHWMGGSSVPAIAPGDDRPRLAWAIPITVDGRPVTIEGELRWPPPPTPAPWLAGSVIGGAVVVLIAGRGRAGAGAVLVILAAALGALALGTNAYVDSTAWHRLELAAYNLVALVVVVFAAAAMRRAMPSDRASALLFAGIAAAVGGGLSRVRYFWDPVLPVAGPPWFARLIVLTITAAGVGLAVRGGIDLWRAARVRFAEPEDARAGIVAG